MLETCDSTPSIPAVSPKAESPATVKEAVPPAAASSDSSDVRIASIDCKGKPEVVTIENSGASTQDLTGWKVSDDGLGHTFNFPNGFLLGSGSSVKLVSGRTLRVSFTGKHGRSGTTMVILPGCSTHRGKRCRNGSVPRETTRGRLRDGHTEAYPGHSRCFRREKAD